MRIIIVTLIIIIITKTRQPPNGRYNEVNEAVLDSQAGLSGFEHVKN